MSFISKFINSTNGYSDRQRQAAELLIAGVAFQEDGRNWIVISHDGDEIGRMSTFIVSETACMLKKAGLKCNNSVHYQGEGVNPYNPSLSVVTFGHNNFPIGEIEAIMKRRFRRPLTLM